jgi:eukaryotic-like serine/threonine-protein kinase
MSDPTSQYKPGDEVEGFRVISEVGKGAASVVYLVQDPKTKQIWSLKHVMKDEEAKDNRFLDQAILEYEVASKLDHPSIRKIPKLVKKNKKLFQLGEVYLVMEYVDGVAMDKKPPKTLDDALMIFVQVSEALAHMHVRGFVHADMKPNNIMLTPGPLAKLIDLGQSCPVNTVKPRIQGTPDYIAPEQVHRRPITPKTDIYNLGATMYFVFSGGRKVPTALAQGDSLVSRIDDSLMEKPTPLAELRPQLPARLCELVMQCVEVDGDHRPESMTAVAERLKTVLGLLRARRNDGSGGGPAMPGVGPGGSGTGMNAASGGFKINNGSSSTGMSLNEQSAMPAGGSSDDSDDI